MKFLLKVCATLCCFYGIVLPLVFGGFPGRPAQATTNPGAPADFSFVQHGSILSPLLKALSEQYTERDLTPRLRPDSRYVRYMKRLYRVSSKQDRTYGKITSHVYNTVRLIAPRDECFEHSKDLLMQGLLYNLDRVRAQEQLLKSVLLYSFDKDLETPFTSVCYLDVKEQENADQQFCSSSHYSVSFKAHIERSHGHKWVEVDITTLLHPFIKSQKKNIYLLINLTCVEDRRQDGGAHECRDFVKLSFRSPSLLLYLNDTSEVAYQRWPSARSKNARQSVAMGDFMSPMEFEPAKRNKRWNRNLSKKPATLPSPAPSPTEHFPKYEFPTDDCDLYDFRVSFSQLKLDHWIIAPHKYNPRYCKGLCPRALGSVYGSPVHTMVQNIIYEKLDSSVPRPSCVPSEYNPLSVLTVENDGSIAYKEYEEMIATKCTCR